MDDQPNTDGARSRQDEAWRYGGPRVLDTGEVVDVYSRGSVVLVKRMDGTWCEVDE